MTNEEICENSGIEYYIEKGFTVHVGRLHTDGEAEELLLANLEIDYESDTLIIRHKAR